MGKKLRKAKSRSSSNSRQCNTWTNRRETIKTKRLLKNSKCLIYYEDVNATKKSKISDDEEEAATLHTEPTIKPNSARGRYRQFSERESERTIFGKSNDHNHNNNDERESGNSNQRVDSPQHDYHEEATTSARASKSFKSSHSAIKPPHHRETFSFAKCEVNGIHKLVAATTASSSSSGSIIAPKSAITANAGTNRNEPTSSNEVSELQRRVSAKTDDSSSECGDNLLQRNDDFGCQRLIDTNEESNLINSQVVECCPKNAETDIDDEGKTNTTTTNSATSDHKVKYRNLGNSPKDKQISSEVKRQSRLSLTLGLAHLTAGSRKPKSNTATTSPEGKELKEEKESSSKTKRKSFIYQKSQSADGEPLLSSPKNNSSTEEEEKLSKNRSLHGQSARKFLFQSKSKSIDSEEAHHRDNSLTAERKLGALQKSKEFLSDIFMARGRNHNRNNRSQSQTSSMNNYEVTNQSNSLLPSTTVTSNTNRLVNNNNNNMMNSPNHNGQNNGNWTKYSTPAHLETISDPSHSYQMTRSNNSPNNFSQALSENISSSRQERSNSAEHVSGAAEAEEERQRRTRSLSREIQQRENFRREQQQSAGVENSLQQHPQFIHASNIERNGINGNAENCLEQQQQHQQQRKNLRELEQNTGKVANSLRGLYNGNNAQPHNAQQHYNELTECDRNSLILTANNSNNNNNDHNKELNEHHRNNIASASKSMGQSNGKPEPTNSRASTPREFRESVFSTEEQNNISAATTREASSKPQVILPTITVVDYGSASDSLSQASSRGSSASTPLDKKEVFFEFDNNSEKPLRHDSGVHITTLEEELEQSNEIEELNEDDMEQDDDDDDDDEVFHEQQQSTPQASSTNMFSSSPKWMPHYLENVPEQEEEEEDEDYEDEGHDSPHATAATCASNLDNEFFGSPEPQLLKSTNNSDSNLSNSFPDSGIGDCRSASSSHKNSAAHHQQHHQPGEAESLLSFQRSTNYVNFHSPSTNNRSGGSSSTTTPPRMPFVRDGYSTDCDETLMQCDDLLDCVVNEVNGISGGGLHSNERLVCIESISLPDVVVESTSASSCSLSCSMNANNSNSSSSASSSKQDRDIININGATGNSMGNIHFIPIHVEGSNNTGDNNKNRAASPKRPSLDDSVIGSSGRHSPFAAYMNDSKPTIEIIEDGSEVNNNFQKHNGFGGDEAAEKLSKELQEQKSQFTVKLEDAQNNVQNLQGKVSEMQSKIESLELELSTKAWNVERLQGELKAAQRDDEYVRKKLKILEDEKTNLRHKYCENEDEFKEKYEELEEKYQELEQKYKEIQSLASSLQTQLAAAQSEAEDNRQELERVRSDLEDQLRILKNALENSEAELKICEDKWQKEFEMLRTQNIDREESLMTDCEWQLRQMQKQCKDKVEKSDMQRYETLEKVENLEEELEERRKEVDDLKIYENQVKSLRGVVSEQDNSIKSLNSQIETLKVDLETANKNLEDQIEAVKRIKYLCDNAIYDKERQLNYRIDEVRNDAACFWEDKLYTEMTRLKNELESVYVDERRESLDKLQTEHIEELRALTTRYTANEEELRAELADLQLRYDHKNSEFLELREKSDNALLQTRMHLDRADRDFQNAMFREEEKREALEQSLREEFEKEKEEMEEKFRERLGHVKEEFAKELKFSTQEMVDEHRKNLDKLKAKLIAEKDEALQQLGDRHRQKLAAAEEKIKETELRHRRDLKDLKMDYDAEKVALDKRDISNANEIEQLHRKCRCLTNLFEEMRMRYERRDPRAEDLREIAELRARCDSQERDLYILTDRLREMQIQMNEMQESGANQNSTPANNARSTPRKPPPKTIPTNCDVIYEENEERESPPPANNEDDEDEEEEDSGEENESSPDPLITLSDKKMNKQNLNRINEDDSHMISAV